MPRVIDFTEEHHKRLAVRLIGVRNDLADGWASMKILPVDMYSVAEGYLRHIATLHAERNKINRKRKLTDKRNERLGEIEAELRAPQRRMDRLTDGANDIENAVMASVRSFTDALFVPEFREHYKMNASDREIVRQTMNIAVWPSKVPSLGLSDRLADAPNEPWTPLALAFRDSDKPYTDALDAALRATPPDIRPFEIPV